MLNKVSVSGISKHCSIKPIIYRSLSCYGKQMSSDAIIFFYIDDFFVILWCGNCPSNVKTVIVFFWRNSHHTLDIYRSFYD